MAAAVIRHLRSLRTMERERSWIHTLLEDAENERMHLLTGEFARHPHDDAGHPFAVRSALADSKSSSFSQLWNMRDRASSSAEWSCSLKGECSVRTPMVASYTLRMLTRAHPTTASSSTLSSSVISSTRVSRIGECGSSPSVHRRHRIGKGQLTSPNPRSSHRFVGYLEEEAVKTYSNIIKDIEDGRLPEWEQLPAARIAQEYWNFGPDAKILDVIYAIRADEATHR